jgi:hypothetical protein
MTSTPVFPQTIKNGVQSFLSSTGSGSANKLTLYTAGSNGSKIESLIISSTDTSARDMVFIVTISAVNYILTMISIPITAGLTNAIPNVDILRSTQFVGLANDANGNRYIYLASGTTLAAYMNTTITSGKEIDVFIQAGDY